MSTSCYDIQRLLPKYRRSECQDAAYVEEHLKTCGSCSAELERLGGMLKAEVYPDENEETNRAVRLVEMISRHLWMQILLAVCAVVFVFAYCFIFGNALMGSYLYLYNLKVTIFMINI